MKESKIFVINRICVNLGNNINKNKMKALVFISFVSLSLLSCQSELDETIVTENDREVQEQRYLDYVAKRNSLPEEYHLFQEKIDELNKNKVTDPQQRKKEMLPAAKALLDKWGYPENFNSYAQGATEEDKIIQLALMRHLEIFNNLNNQ